MGTDLGTIQRHIKIIINNGYDIVDQITQQYGQVMICFDDGWAGIYDAKDFFISNSIHPTIFIAVDLIGKHGYLSLEQIKELQGNGFIFEGHSWSHHDLTCFDKSALKHELFDSKLELSKLLGKPIDAICFPRGRFSDVVLNCCFEAGYQKMYSSITGGYYDLLVTKKVICRNLVQDVSDNEFKFILNSTSPFFVRRSLRMHFLDES